MLAPTLTTDRLVLLPPDPLRDVEAMTAMYADAAVSAWAPGRQPIPREEVWLRLLRYVGQWYVMGYGGWIVHERDGGGFVGNVGLFDNQRDTEPSFRGTPEAGWAITAELHGRGFATEALAAVFAWADARPIERIVCMIAPDNARSIRVASRLGFQRLTAAVYHDEPVELYERSRSALA